MIDSLFSLAFYSTIGGGTIGNLLFQWESAGVFSYVLPFLVIFALIFGILSTMNLFGNNKAINAIIALAVGLMALQFNFVSIFFSEVFPRMGIVLAVVLVIIILLGLFLRDEEGNLHKNFRYVMVGIVGIMTIWVIVSSLDSFGWYTGYGFWYGLSYYLSTIIGVVVVVGALAAIIIMGGKRIDEKKKKKGSD